MRSAGCVINDFADRNFDRHVERTRDRPLAARLDRAVGSARARRRSFSCCAFLLVLQTNRLTIMLSFVARRTRRDLPFLKRLFSFPQAWLGIAFGFSIPMAYAAQYGKLVPVAWVTDDREYVLGDRLRHRVRDGGSRRRRAPRPKSSAILFGRYDVAGVMASHDDIPLMMASSAGGSGCGVLLLRRRSWPRALVYHQHMLIRDREREACFKAFLNNNWVGARHLRGTGASISPRAARWLQ